MTPGQLCRVGGTSPAGGGAGLWLRVLTAASLPIRLLGRQCPRRPPTSRCVSPAPLPFCVPSRAHSSAGAATPSLSQPKHARETPPTHGGLLASPLLEKYLRSPAFDAERDEQTEAPAARQKLWEAAVAGCASTFAVFPSKSSTFTHGLGAALADAYRDAGSPRSAPARVVVAVSGGVDSSVSLYLLKRRGFDVMGVYMRNWDEVDEVGHCRGEQDMKDAALICQAFQVPFRTVNFVKEYWNEVFAVFLEEYKRGLTPNPDILCNKEIKFKYLFKYATDILGADFVATGHYARVQRQPEAKLLAAEDAQKDQTYFLAAVPGSALRRTLFPVGGLKKAQVKQIARELGLDELVAKKESTGICFIGKRKFADFIAEYIPQQPGPIETLDGRVIGEHKGHFFYTIGQSRLLPPPFKLSVVAKIGSRNAVIVAPKPSAISSTLSEERSKFELSEHASSGVASDDPEYRSLVASLHESHPGVFVQMFTTGVPEWISGTAPPELRTSMHAVSEAQYIKCLPEIFSEASARTATNTWRGLVRYRYRARLFSCQVQMVECSHGQSTAVERKLVVKMDLPGLSVAPGQFAVFYTESGECLGGCAIEQTDVFRLFSDG